MPFNEEIWTIQRLTKWERQISHFLHQEGKRSLRMRVYLDHHLRDFSQEKEMMRIQQQELHLDLLLLEFL